MLHVTGHLFSTGSMYVAKLCAGRPGAGLFESSTWPLITRLSCAGFPAELNGCTLAQATIILVLCESGVLAH
jgi:hypothetical protein